MIDDNHARRVWRPVFTKIRLDITLLDLDSAFSYGINEGFEMNTLISNYRI
jgi:hypothetical protein